MTNCFACGDALIPDSCYDNPEDCTYQFDNCLWIGLHGGYGMFCDNLQVKFPNNDEDRYLRNSDEKDEWGFSDWVTVTDEEGNLHPVENPMFEPTYDEVRILPGRPDYECVICHECAHKLWEAAPWLSKLFPARMGHTHKKGYLEAHPEHDAWENDIDWTAKPPVRKENL